MRLNGTLISSFLFVSAVLAGDQLEKRQPPFLDRVEKSINSTTFLPIADLAGITWTAYPGETVETVAGTFIVPGVEGNVGLDFVIMVGISTSMCSDSITVGGGIFVRVTPNGVTYQSFAHWERGTTVVSTMPISAGDVIRASIHMTSTTTAVVTFTNVGRGQSRRKNIGGPPQTPGCKQAAEWIIATTYPITPLPIFGSVIIKEMSVKVYQGNEIVPRRPYILVTNIDRPQVETCAFFYRDHLVIVYIPPPPPG